MHLEADITKITNHTDWRPSVEIHDGLVKTINWLRSEKQSNERH